ncbi:MAG: type IV toxin-antitoxin system AbiEi family antitoxin domain-containing protein [Friedmanniella sp.]
MEAVYDVLAAAHRGVFTRAQALAAGIGDRELQWAVRVNVLVRLRRGCYSPAPHYAAQDEIGRYLLLARAAIACQLGPVALTSVTAAAVHGLDLYQQDLGVVHLVRLDAGSSRNEMGIRHHRLTHDIAADVKLVDGFPVVSPARAVWEVASGSSLEAGVCTADSALRRWPDLRNDLLTVGGTFGRRPGSRTARMAMQLADGRAGSVGESLSRVLFYRHALPCPELQHHVHSSLGQLLAITDFYWPECRHVGEFDGKVKYAALLREGETPGDVVFREKRREDDIRATGRGVTRWTWADLTPGSSAALVHRLRSDLDRSRRLYVRSSA